MRNIGMMIYLNTEPHTNDTELQTDEKYWYDDLP